MDEVPLRNHVDAHAKAVIHNDLESVTNDFAPELRGQVSDVAEQLPQPVTSADVERVDVAEDHADVRIRYSNEEESVGIRTRWEEIDGRPMIVEAEPVEE